MVVKMKNDKNRLQNIILTTTQENVSRDDLVLLNLTLQIAGDIRSSFNQTTWEKAYNKFDNTFRVNIEVNLTSDKQIIYSTKFWRKAIFFWTRNPKISHRIWISIIKDDSPFYPLSEEESKTLLFDINKVIELKITDFNKGLHKIYADVTVSWGIHNFTEPTKLKGRSNPAEINISN